VIALGYSDQDPILALGVKPIATRYWWGDEKMAAFPWAQDELGDAKPEVLNMQELNFEKIAALRPDLIIATYGGIKDKDYETLSKIAPTLAQSGQYLDYGMPWSEVTLNIGKVLGREAQAKAIVADIEARFAAVRAKHPDWAGKSVIVGAPFENIFGFMASQDPRSRFFAALGFKVPEAFDKIAGESFYGQLSSERVDLLNTDLLVFHQLQWVKGGRAAIEADPLLSKSESLQQKRAIFLEGVLDDAFQFNSVLSLPMVLDEVVPMIEAVMRGQTQASAASREVTDARGNKVSLPAEIKRVVALTELDLDSALALGIAPVGSVNGRGQAGLPLYLGEKAKDIPSVGSLAEPSLEKIVGLKPDVILAGSMIPQIEALLPELSKIAPVVATYKPADDWKTAFKSIAGVLNQSAKADEFLASYDKRAAAIKAALPANKPAEANVVRWMPQGPVLMMPATFSSRVLADVGLSRPQEVQALAGSHGAHTDPISLEKLDVIDSEWLFWGALNPDGATALETALKNPLVQKLNAVQNKHVAQVDGAVWTSIGGPLAALVVLDDVEKALKAP
jgi:iron complex transport system substrate-binding protein